MTEFKRDYLMGLKNEDLVNALINTHVKIEHMYNMRSKSEDKETYKYYDEEYCDACNDYIEIHKMITDRMRKDNQ